MYLEVSAMTLLELHRTLEVGPPARDARGRCDAATGSEALAAADEASDRVVGVALDDGPGRRGDASPDVGRTEDLDPASGAEHRQRRLVRPVQAHPKS